MMKQILTIQKYRRPNVLDSTFIKLLLNPLSVKWQCRVNVMPDMTPTSLAAAVAPRKIAFFVFERGENFLQNYILHFVFMLRQSPQIVLQS